MEGQCLLPDVRRRDRLRHRLRLDDKMIGKLLTLGAAGSSRLDEDATSRQRRLRTPWHVEDLAGCFVIKAKGGQELAYLYYEDDPSRRSIVKLLSREEARQIATAIARLPDLVRRI